MSRDVICVVWLDYADKNNYVLVENLVCVHCVVTNHFFLALFFEACHGLLQVIADRSKPKLLGAILRKKIFLFFVNISLSTVARENILRYC